ncbi:MAG: hypothetical protein M1838_002873 [Thelocarpon superellum]|nr:MAG: hypothetical protein M1838_002873 [Thelocarpon superellum]
MSLIEDPLPSRVMFDLTSESEFPSLSSAQSQHNQNAGQAAWASATQRGASHAAQHRAHQQPTPSQTPLPQGQGPSGQAQPPHQDNLFPSSSQFVSGLDDFGFGAPNTVGPLTGSSQPKTGSIDEFPPLGRNANGEIGQARGAGGVQHGPFGAQLSSNGFGTNISQASSGQGRNGLLGAVPTAQDRSRQLGLNNARSPIESLQQGPGGASDSERSVGQNGSTISSLFSSMQNPGQSGASSQTSQPNLFAMAPASRPSLPSQPPPAPTQPTFTAEYGDSPRASQTQTPDTLSSMSELDRFGLAGLLHMIRSEGSDLGSLAIGQDLTTLGLDLSQPEPLYPSFANAFGEAGARGVEPDFAVPACYNVQNIHPLNTKVSSFSDETLFYVFYQMPRDVMQEVVAAELSNRNWRWHRELKQWLTKDTSFEPVRINAAEERGFYIFFDPVLWQRQRREFLLQYDQLDARVIAPASSAHLQ